MRAAIAGAALALLCATSSAAQAPAADSTVARRLEWRGFVDSYFAHDFGRPPARDRVFTTQAVRHGEFNVNLAYADLRVSDERIRGRLAAQVGTSVHANYAAEPTVGAISGHELSRLLQEAFAGVRVGRRLWIDAGIMLAPFGAESWISSENWTYTRSLIADNSPYYEAGVRATWQVSSRLSGQLHVMNGWQNISETNSDKALGARVDWSPGPVSLAYALFAGNEQADSLQKQPRLFQELIARARLSRRLEAVAVFDHGRQRGNAAGAREWRGWSVITRLGMSDRATIGARVEGYSDPEQVVVLTGRPTGLRARGVSLNVDVQPSPSLLWRLELRGLRSTDAVFPDASTVTGLGKDNLVLVSSVALTLSSAATR